MERSSLGDRAVVIAAVLAVLIVGLFGAEPAGEPAPRTAQVQSR